MARFKAWFASLPLHWQKRLRTLTQVCFGVLAAAAVDYGMDGAIAWRDFVFGDGGIIILATYALATGMNRAPRD